MYDIYYVGAQNGERINFCQFPYMVTGGDLFSGDYDTVDEDDRIQEFNRKITSHTLEIEIRSKDRLAQAVDELNGIAEKDLINVTPGKLYVGESYLKCWLTGTDIGRWVNDLDSVSNKLTVKSDYPYWITEKSYHFLKQSQGGAVSPWLDYPYGQPYEYAKVRNLQYIQNDGYADSGFRMIIYGPCINPLIRIGGHVYELRTTLYEDEYAVIDSSTRYTKDRKIIKVKVDGTREDIFNSRNTESEIWQKIPPGRSIVSWSGAFGFDIILFNERGTPRWTLS